MNYNKKEEIYSSKANEISYDVEFAYFTNYNWWKQAKAHVEPLLTSLEANINVSLALRAEQLGRGKSVHRLVPIDKTHCLVLSHTKQFEKQSGDAVFNTAYLYVGDWASILAQFANKGKESQYLINLTCREIFKRYGKGRAYLLRQQGNFDDFSASYVIKSFLRKVGGEIPISGREYWDFILPQRRGSLHRLLKKIDEADRKGEDIGIWNLYYNYSSIFHMLNHQIHKQLKEVIVTLSSFFRGGDKIEQSVRA